jgi:hypothetical protein
VLCTARVRKGGDVARKEAGGPPATPRDPIACFHFVRSAASTASPHRGNAHATRGTRRCRGQGGGRGVVGRQRARPERQETCPACASGCWQRMRSASPGLSSTRTRGLSVVDRGTQTSRGGEFRRNNLLHVTACGSCRAVARREDVTASHGWLWACRDNKETLVCGVRSRQHRMDGRCSFNVPPTALIGGSDGAQKCTRACVGWVVHAGTLTSSRETPTSHR